LILGYFYLPESPRWLLLKDRREEAEKIFHEAAKINGVTLDSNLELMVNPDELELAKKEESRAFYETYPELFDKSIRNVTLPLIGVWVSFAFTYYGLIFLIARIYSGSSDDGGTPTCSYSYPPILENTSSEIAGITIFLLVINYWGRVKTQVIPYFVGGIAVLILALTHNNLQSVAAMGFIARIMIMGASCATWVATPEIFPTNLRATGHSLCNCCARLGAFACSYVVVSSISIESVGIVLFATFTTAAVAASILPETSGVSLDEAVRRSYSVGSEPVMAKFQHNIDAVVLTTNRILSTAGSSADHKDLLDHLRPSSSSAVGNSNL